MHVARVIQARNPPPPASASRCLLSGCDIAFLHAGPEAIVWEGPAGCGPGGAPDTTALL
ncbi:hypothetical protein ASPCADRAFT_207425, partial [Aspergillus carbonarius ITEM 5010]